MPCAGSLGAERSAPSHLPKEVRIARISERRRQTKSAHDGKSFAEAITQRNVSPSAAKEFAEALTGRGRRPPAPSAPTLTDRFEQAMNLCESHGVRPNAVVRNAVVAALEAGCDDGQIAEMVVDEARRQSGRGRLPGRRPVRDVTDGKSFAAAITR